MITRNYLASQSGTIVASGEGVATITTQSISLCQWAIGDSATVAPTIAVRHQASFANNVSMSLGVGEHLWIFGSQIVAVTATNAAAGDI